MLEVRRRARAEGCFARVPVLARESASLGEQSPMLAR